MDLCHVVKKKFFIVFASNSEKFNNFFGLQLEGKRFELNSFQEKLPFCFQLIYFQEAFLKSTMSQQINPPLGSTDIAKLSIPTLPQVTTEPPKQNGLWSSNPVFSYINDVYITINEHRKSLGLTNPGTIENLNKEVARDVFGSIFLHRVES